MSIPVYIIVMSALTAIIYKCLKHEKELIELEDKIIEDIRDFVKQTKKKRKFEVVKNNPSKNHSSKNRASKNCMASRRENDTAA